MAALRSPEQAWRHGQDYQRLTLRMCWASRAGISPRRKMALALKTCESLHMKAMIQRRPSEVCTVSVKM